jgi:hypothetical protein
MRRRSLPFVLSLTFAVGAVGPFPSVAGASNSKSATSSSKGAKTSRVSKSTKSTKSSKSTKSTSKKKSKRSRRHQAKREVSRTPNRRTATNMPRGWSWPPNKAMVVAGDRCTAELDAAGIGWKPAPAEGKIVTPILLSSLQIGGIEYHSVFRKPPFPMDCHLALALVTHSPALYDLGVRKVNFGSIFRYTKVRAYGKTKNVLSRHALGLAMDVVSFEDADGLVRVVEKDYPLGDEVLTSVESTLNGSGGFRTVLTPRNDPASHHDHFHIEADVRYYEDERNLASLRRADADAANADADADADAANADASNADADAANADADADADAR